MKSTAANHCDRKPPRWTSLVMTVTSMGLLVASPAIAEIRQNPFAASTDEPAVIRAEPMPSAFVDSATANLSSPVTAVHPKRLPPVLPKSTPEASSETRTRSQEASLNANDDLGQPTAPETTFKNSPTAIEQTPRTQLALSAKTQRENVIEIAGVTSQVAPEAQGQESGASRSLEPRLRSTTAQSKYRQSREQLDQAIMEYRVGALASAEASVWMALRGMAEAADIQQEVIAGQDSFVDDLTFASHAIRESRDFFGLPVSAIHRIAMSHQTKLLDAASEAKINANDAIDLYLDEARVRLARIAALNLDAAEAMDVMAAIYLGRGEPPLMPGPFSLCMRRAALQGQPGNANLATRLGMQLADTGLHDEAYIVLKHAYALEPNAETSDALQSVARLCGQPATVAEDNPRRDRSNATPLRPDVIQLSPNEFAAISQPVMQVGATHDNSGASSKDDRQVLSDESASAYEMYSSDTQNESPSRLKRLTGSLTRFWK